MASITQRTRAPEILEHVRITEVWRALGGGELRHGRGQAFWREGAGYNVSLRDDRNVWHDKRDDIGGGVLDLVVRVRGGNRASALRWCADLVGVPMEDRPLSPADRERWARERRELERDLPAAQLWRRAALALGEEILDRLKAGLFDPAAAMRPESGEVAEWTARLARWRRLDGAALVAEYADWRRDHPDLTAGMVWAARTRDAAERRALEVYVRMTMQEGYAA